MKLIKIIISLIFLFSYFSTFAQYQKNIEDEYKIYLMEKKVSDILKQSNHPEKLSQKYRKIIEKRLGENNVKMAHYNNATFQEYALKRIYEALYYNAYLGDFSIKEHHFKILENKYIKTFTKEPNLYIDDTSVYAMPQNDTRKIDYLVFHEVDKTTDIQEYILENFYDEKYKGICELEELKNSHMNFFETPTYHFEEQIQDTAEGPFFKRLCGKLNKGTFTRISDTVIIYIPWQYEYVGLDFNLIEIKEGNELYLRKVLKRDGDQIDFYKIPNIDAKKFKILSHRVGYDEKYFVLFESYEKNPSYSYLQLLEGNFQNVKFTPSKGIFRHQDGFIVCYTGCVNFDKQSDEYTNIQEHILGNDSNSQDAYLDFNKDLISKYSNQGNFIINDGYISGEKDFDSNKGENSFEIIEIK